MKTITYLVLVVALCGVPLPAGAQARSDARPIVVQGAMAIETDRLAARLENATIETIAAWRFWRGTISGYPVIVSRTNKGMSNAAAATALAIERYRPAAIINQGTSGGHDPALRVYDIVIGTSSVNVGAFRAPFRAVGAGSDPLKWWPLDLLAEGSAGGPDAPRKPSRFEGDATLIAAARGARSAYSRGRVVEGVIGSSDVWNDELDRIARFHQEFATSVEEMETASAAQVAATFSVPFLGIRILSDNITNGGAYDPKTGEACEDYVYAVVEAFVAGIRK